MESREESREQSRERHGDREATHDRRDAEADARDDAADRREHEHDIREGVLDRWERQLTERALAFDRFDEADEVSQRRDREQRAQAHRRRRADAEARREEATQRAIDREVERATVAPPGADASATHATDSPADYHERIQHTVDGLAALVDDGAGLADTLTAILQIAADALDDVAGVSVTLAVDGKYQPAASSTSWAHDLDATQTRLGIGPVIEAIDGRTIVVADDLAGDERWDLGPSLGAAGRRGALSAPIVGGSEVRGALTAYARPGRSFGARSVLTASLLASHASLAVGWSLERLAHRAQADAWERALASRDRIGQAKGILMELHGLTSDEAFELLRATSQRHNTKVREIADHVAVHRRLPDVVAPQRDTPRDLPRALDRAADRELRDDES